jgi:6-phosphogluconolactonase (cycloisomerase 2 family)
MKSSFVSAFVACALAGLPGLLPSAVAAEKPSVLPASATSYLITNDDLPPKIATSATFFTIGSTGALSNPARVSLGGVGSGGGYFAANRVSILNNATTPCAFVSLGSSGEIGAVDIHAQQDIGNFQAETTDTGTDNGVGLANNGTYLYASFSTSYTLATFAIQAGCGLQFLGDIAPLGKHGGDVKGMAVHGNLMVVTYGDGSIESFNISSGIPVSNGDLQNATGYTTDRFPNGVDITKDGHYAVFGDMSTTTTVEVSDISSGKLTKTILYNFTTAANSNSVYLSPDETLLYIVNSGTGQVSAEFFDAGSGKITKGCTSNRLKGFDGNWNFMSSPVTQLNTGTGSVLYVSEFGSTSGVAALNVTSSAGKCALTEATGSPFVDPDSTFLLSIGVYPPRSF